MNDWIKRGLNVTPSGSQTRSKAAVNFPGLEGYYVASAEGSKITTVDGKTYIDMLCGMGASILGYGHPKIVEAVVKQARQGTVYGLPHRLEVEVSERFLRKLDLGFESIRWVKTGSEACSAAMRIARRATGREVIITSDQSYHGWHDGFIASKEEHPGVPETLTGAIKTFKYNDIDHLKKVIFEARAETGKSIAAIMMEPSLYEKPKPGFLKAVKDLAHANGALFILDEMILGARIAWAGGQELFGVKADLATYGKAIAGGYPLACVVGSRDLMQYADVISGTFGGDAVSLAACNAVMDVYENEDVFMRLSRNGGRIRKYLNLAFALATLQAEVEGWLSVWRIKWSGDHAEDLRMLWTEDMLARIDKIIWHPWVCFVSAALTEDDLAAIEGNCYEASKIARYRLEADAFTKTSGPVGQKPVR